jgi:hypothetical protein
MPGWTPADSDEDVPDVATLEQVEATIASLISRLDSLDTSSRSMLPSRRLVETTCPDLDTTWHALWEGGEVHGVIRGRSPRRPDIRVKVNSDDLLALADGSLPFRQAWQAGRIKLDASVTDMLRLRASL